jgi:hypothetical protein
MRGVSRAHLETLAAIYDAAIHELYLLDDHSVLPLVARLERRLRAAIEEMRALDAAAGHAA